MQPVKSLNQIRHEGMRKRNEWNLVRGRCIIVSDNLELFEVKNSFLLIMPYGLIIYAKIKTQCTSKGVLELVGSPAVLCYAG